MNFAFKLIMSLAEEINSKKYYLKVPMEVGSNDSEYQTMSLITVFLYISEIYRPRTDGRPVHPPSCAISQARMV